MSFRILLVAVPCALVACSSSKTADPAKDPAGTGSGSGSASNSAPAPSPDAEVPEPVVVAPDAAEAGSGSGSGDGFAFTVSTPLEKNTFAGFEHDMQIKFMRDFVVPQMKAEFQAFDPVKYAVFGCKTCHGKDFKDRKYKMPNPNLPKLDFAKLKAGTQEPKMAKFMELHVKPDMIKILNATPYDDKHPDGFGCLTCHEAAK